MKLIDKLYYHTLKPDLPRVIMIEPTNSCNLKCHMCDYQKQFTGERSYLSLKEFELIIAQFPSVRELIFCGLGEPLLNKNIFEMISLAANKKINFINLITNGILLTEKCFTALIKSGLTRIQISFHSTDSEIASKINGAPPGIHDVLRTNILNALKIRNDARPELYFVLNSVINNINYNDIFDLIDFCEVNKVDEISFVQLTTIFGKYDSFNIGENQAKILVKEIRAKFKKSKLKISFLSGNETGRCYQLWNFLMIHADGNISPCNGIMPQENKKIGNLIHANIAKIWHSDKYVELRKSVIEKRLSNCKYCEVGYPMEGKNFKWFNNYYIKPALRSLYSYVRG